MPQKQAVANKQSDPIAPLEVRVHEIFDHVLSSISVLDKREAELKQQIEDNTDTYDVKKIHARTLAKSELGEVQTALENAHAEHERLKEDSADELAQLYRNAVEELRKPIETVADEQEQKIKALRVDATKLEDDARNQIHDSYNELAQKVYEPYKQYFPITGNNIAPTVIRKPTASGARFGIPHDSFTRPAANDFDEPTDHWGRPVAQHPDN